MIKVYSTIPPCPKCKVLKKKLEDNHIKYDIETDINVMIDKGFTQVPVLEVDGITMGYKMALEWINKQ